MTSDDRKKAGSGRASSAVRDKGAAPRPEVRPPRAERRPEMIRQRREQRQAAYQRQQRAWLLTRIGLGLAGVVIIGVIGFFVFQFIQDQRLNVTPEGVVDYAYVGAQHSTEPVAYAETPPVGGSHDPVWQNCGFYDVPIRSENAVHSLEHGAVWITYDPELPAEQVDILRQAASQPYILVSPFEGLPSSVVASSWNHQLLLDSADDPRLDQFVRVFRQGPDTPEPGALCIGGVGTPS